MSDPKSILVVGSAALDSLETSAGSEEDALGGSSFYFSTAASLYAPVRLVAVIGSDFPMEKIEFLKSRNVDISGLQIVDGETFRWGGGITPIPTSGTLYSRNWVFLRVSIPLSPNSRKKTPFVFLGNIHPTLQLQVLDQIEEPELVVLDTMNLWIDTTPDELEKVIQRCAVVILNDEELAQLTGDISLIGGAELLLERGPHTVVVKKGQHGAVLFRKGGDVFFSPAYPLKIVKDPTGAGDTFAGGFIGYLASQDLDDPKAWRRAVVHGSVMGSFVVEEFSMRRTAEITVDDVEARVADFRNMTEF